MNATGLRAARRAARQRWRRARRAPFESGQRPLVLHATYHKCGTVWFVHVLRSLSEEFGLRFEVARNRASAPTRGTDIFLHPNTKLDIDALGNFRGTHMVRDPRDIVVSAYHYHLWTNEVWANRPDERLGGRGYREHLQSLDQDAGLMAEIERLHGVFARMSTWDYEDPRFLELRFEDLRAEGPSGFERIFRHYGFTDEATERGLFWATYHSWENAKQREVAKGSSGPSHLRSGRSGEWREVLSPAHLARIDELVGPVMSRLGYS